MLRGSAPASLIAALDVGTGKVIATDVARNDSGLFIEFLDQLDEQIDPDLAIHVVLDNGSSHRSRATKQWFAEHLGSWSITPRSTHHG